jgi:hypothetical protein
VQDGASRPQNPPSGEAAHVSDGTSSISGGKASTFGEAASVPSSGSSTSGGDASSGPSFAGGYPEKTGIMSGIVVKESESKTQVKREK